MGKIIKNGIEYSGSGATEASKLIYNNSESDLKATNVNDAIDELKTEIDNKVDITDSRLTDARTPKAHNHDDRYYTETEIDNKFNTTNQNVTNNANAITQLNSDLNTMERFQVSSPYQEVPATYLKQNCYKIGNKVHIEFIVSRSQDTPSNSPWAMIPKAYAPNKKYGSNTGYTGLCIVEVNGVYIPNSCGCFVNPPDDNNPSYGMLYQGMSSNVASDKRVMVMLDYYI